MAHLSPYLSFGGNCREALAFYQRCLGGTLSPQTFAESPYADQLPAEARQGILHGSLTASALTLFCSDAGSLRTPLVVGNSVSLSLSCESDAEIETLFAQLGEGGTVVDPLTEMFWGAKFGALTDRFGTRWLFNYAKVGH